MSEETKAEVKAEVQSTTNKPAKQAKKAKKNVSKKTAKKAKKVAAPAKRGPVSEEAAEGYNERALEALKEKASATKVTGKDATTKLMQATSLFLVKFRKQNNLTCAQLAEKLDIDPTVVSHLESGKRSLIRLDKIVEYATKMRVKPEVMAAQIFGLAGV